MIKTIVNQYIISDPEARTRYAEQLAKGLGSDWSLLELIQSLGDSLTSDTDVVRASSIGCLVDTLQLSGGSKLTRHDVNVLVEFLVAKLDDELSVGKVLAGLATLVAFDTFGGNNLERILSSIIDGYDPRRFLAAVRYESFGLLRAVVVHHRQYLWLRPGTNELFLRTFLHIASGEKDPRNLLISFEINRTINETLMGDASEKGEKASDEKASDEKASDEKASDEKVSDEKVSGTTDAPLATDTPPRVDYASELFDVCFCYFPISFTPPANDPYKITADELKTSLRATIAVQRCSKEVFPSLFEKLTSTNPVVRADVLETLLSCVRQTPRDTLVQYWGAIWDALKFEILHNDVAAVTPGAPSIVPDYRDMNDADDAKQVFLTLAIVHQLGRAMPPDFPALFAGVSSELRPNLAARSKAFKQSVLLLCQLATPDTAAAIVDYLFSHWAKYLGIEVEQKPEKQDESPHSADSPYTDFTHADVSEPDVLDVAGQRALVEALGYVFVAVGPDPLVQYKDHVLVFLGRSLSGSSSLEKTLKVRSIQQLVRVVTMGLADWQETRLVLGYLRDALAESVASERRWDRDLVIKELVRGVVAILDTDHRKSSLVIEEFLPVLLVSDDPQALSLLQQLCVNYQMLEVYSVRFLNKMETGPFDSIVRMLTECVYHTEARKQFLMNSWYDKFVARFLAVLERRNSGNSGGTGDASSTPRDALYEYDLSGNLVGLIVKFIDKSKHQKILDDFVAWTPAASPKVALFNKVLANIDKSVEVDAAAVPRAIEQARRAHGELRLLYLQNVALWANKFGAEVRQQAAAGLGGTSAAVPATLDENFEVSVWLVKALVMRMDEFGTSLMVRIVDLVGDSDPAVKGAAARALGIVFADLPVFTNQTPLIKGVVSKVSCLNVRRLYKQRMFEMIMPRIIEGYARARDEYYLLSLSLVLDNLSSEILTPHLETLLPLVMSSVSMDNRVTLRASLATLNVIITESPSLIVPHLSLVPKLLSVSVGERKASDAEIRLMALECLKSIVDNIDVTLISQYHVTRELAWGLDDGRRSVRKLCVDIRQQLYDAGQ